MSISSSRSQHMLADLVLASQIVRCIVYVVKDAKFWQELWNLFSYIQFVAIPISSNNYENPKNYLHNLLINCFSPHDRLHLASFSSNAARNLGSRVCIRRERGDREGLCACKHVEGQGSKGRKRNKTNQFPFFYIHSAPSQPVNSNFLTFDLLHPVTLAFINCFHTSSDILWLEIVLVTFFTFWDSLVAF